MSPKLDWNPDVLAFGNVLNKNFNFFLRFKYEIFIWMPSKSIYFFRYSNVKIIFKKSLLSKETSRKHIR